MGAGPAKVHYLEALKNFEKSEENGANAGGNIKAIHQNCKIRYDQPCSAVFAEFGYKGKSSGEFSLGDDFENDEEEEEEDDFFGGSGDEDWDWADEEEGGGDAFDEEEGGG